ncbi:hypothetical protein JAB5_00670 [Janthinobacterium sp. HH103]|nr:hypothetical protein JAB2_45940 [Janthinobacterium sp. HH100]OEZ80319.1 hypothetical protein JAB8_53500 [Janthinobacterium sp. HH106]OEZ89355.1 hypothetical protein JAB5_00670 [Janthinobacterium sp. HH103]
MPKLAIGWIAMSLKMRVRFTSEPKLVSPDAPNCAPLPVPGPTPYCTPKVLPPPNTFAWRWKADNCQPLCFWP